MNEKNMGIPSYPEKEPPAIKWVNLIAFNNETEETELVARCILEDGEMRFEGNSNLIVKLKAGFPSVGSREKLTPSDGEKFLEGLRKEYRSAYLLASDVLEGDKIEDFEPAKMEDVEPDENDSKSE